MNGTSYVDLSKHYPVFLYLHICVYKYTYIACLETLPFVIMNLCNTDG